MEEKYLPIGTVVMLKNGTQKLMITSYLLFQSKDGNVANFLNGTAEVYDYGACIYPGGVLDANTAYVFNHDDIESIIYLGLKDSSQKELSDKLIKGYEILKNQIKEKQTIK